MTGSGLLGLPDELQAMIDRLEERSGLRRPVRWFLSLRVEVPTVTGWLRPTVLIPAKGWSRLAVQQLEALLAHEIAHIRRHDYLVNICQVCIETVLFFHPAVWWVSKRIRTERENCCDDMAVTLCGGDRLLVARALFALEEQRSGSDAPRRRQWRLFAGTHPTPGRTDLGRCLPHRGRLGRRGPVRRRDRACRDGLARGHNARPSRRTARAERPTVQGCARSSGQPVASTGAAVEAGRRGQAQAPAPEPSKSVKGFGESRRGDIPRGGPGDDDARNQ